VKSMEKGPRTIMPSMCDEDRNAMIADQHHPKEALDLLQKNYASSLNSNIRELAKLRVCFCFFCKQNSNFPHTLRAFLLVIFCSLALVIVFNFFTLFTLPMVNFIVEEETRLHNVTRPGNTPFHRSQPPVDYRHYPCRANIRFEKTILSGSICFLA
jgi:hypothetical protein